MSYFWKLQRYDGQNTRFRCPNCRKGRQYTRFINSKGEYAPYEYGKCNRTEKCGYFNYPSGEKTTAPIFTDKPVEIEYIDWSDYNYDLDTNNDLFQYIVDKTKASPESVLKAFKMYYIRTLKDKLIFPFIDKQNRLTYTKAMQYVNGHRTKYIYSPFKAKEGSYKQCLFGLHLFEQNKIINVVESEKTALIMSIIEPKSIWMATGGSNLYKKINVLDKATIFADKGKAFNDWSSKLDIGKYYMHPILEDKDISNGSDLADYYLD